jgi:hypothetical protein
MSNLPTGCPPVAGGVASEPRSTSGLVSADLQQMNLVSSFANPIFFIPDPGSRLKKIPGSLIRIRIKELSILTHKIVSQLSEI